MENTFKSLSKQLFSLLNKDEVLTLSCTGEKSQFIRLNNAKIRQTGLVDDADIQLKLIANDRTCSGSFTVSGNSGIDLSRGKYEIERMRFESTEILEDPYIVMPSDRTSTHEIKSANGLSFENAVEALMPAVQGIDFVGILANGRMFRGNSNSLGQEHWFETESFCLDYSLVTKNHQMVKGTFAGTDWDQDQYNIYLQNSKRKLELMELKPVNVNTGEYRTWFEPAAVSDFIDMFSWNGISEASIQQGCSGFGKMRHDDVRLSPHFSVSEDFSTGMVPKFNSYGEVSPSIVPIIKEGELVNTLVSSRTAAEYKQTTNYAETGEFLRSPKMEAGSLQQEDVLKALDTGLYLSNIHYLNWSDNPGGRITGLTRYACFWVKNGEIEGPINTMRFDDTFYKYFGNSLEHVGKDTEFIPNTSTYGNREIGGTICPGILANSFALTL
jgi:predicted Zn-dependent protease|tara:strand:+ start:4763 stop:6085 length:1323 start_codon:yes stop_codon:yes gene_type:complete